ncbi:MAG: phosphatase PAP2 family protein [Lachnospiraceae bacterium]|nr:phosphatase PAP2 family protein [Lachnospiraceae bacterium]
MNTSIIKKIYVLREQYSHLWWQVYWLVYLPWFAYLEKTVTKQFHIVHMAVDDYIPFCEYFIVPYLLWFAYIALGIGYFALKNKNEYYNLCKILFSGMTIFLIVSTLCPNGHYLRPTTFARDNIFVDMVQALYATDTSTNLFPSIHVYNSLAVNAVIWHCDDFKQNRLVRYSSAILMVSIVLATMFLKQHSVFDVITGILLAAFTIHMIYRTQPEIRMRRRVVQRLRRI